MRNFPSKSAHPLAPGHTERSSRCEDTSSSAPSGFASGPTRTAEPWRWHPESRRQRLSLQNFDRQIGRRHSYVARDESGTDGRSRHSELGQRHTNLVRIDAITVLAPRSTVENLTEKGPRVDGSRITQELPSGHNSASRMHSLRPRRPSPTAPFAIQTGPAIRRCQLMQRRFVCKLKAYANKVRCDG
jgi:hypothetical protein